MSSTFLKLPTGLKIYLDELHNGIFSHCRTLSFDGTEMKFLPGSLISQVAQQALIERVLTIDPPGPNLSRDIKTAIINRLLTNAKVVFVIAMYSKMPSKSLCHLIYDGSLALAPSACHKSTMACSSNTSKSSWPPASTKDNSIVSSQAFHKSLYISKRVWVRVLKPKSSRFLFARITTISR